MSEAASAIDVRKIIPPERHPTIFGRFNTLQPGEAFELINDHDPRPLYYQLQSLFANTFSWTYLESGPQVWRVKIARTAAAPDKAADGGCCSGGNCG